MKTNFTQFYNSITEDQQGLVDAIMKYFLTQGVRPDMEGFFHVDNYVSEWEHFFFLEEDDKERYFMVRCSYRWIGDVLDSEYQSVTEFKTKSDFDLYRHKMNVISNNVVSLN